MTRRVPAAVCRGSLCHVSCGILLALAVYLVGNAASVTVVPEVGEETDGPPDPVCLVGLTDVVFRRPIVSVRLGNISNVLSMTLAKSSVGYYMSGGFSGSLFTKYCQPVVGNQGRGAMCPSVRWLLTIVNDSECMGPRLMCGLLSDSLALASGSNKIALCHSGAENVISCPEGQVMNLIVLAETCVISCCLLEQINVSTPVPPSNNTSVVGFGSVLMNTMTLIGHLQPSSITVSDISSTVDVARDIEALFYSSNLTGNQTHQLIEQLLTLYDVIHRYGVLINDADSFQLFKSLIYILERIGYLYPPLVGMSETFAAQSISQTLIDASDQDILRTVRYTLDSVIGGGEDDDTVTQGSDIDLSTSSHESSLIDEYDDEDFVAYLQVDVLPATFGMSSCHRDFGNSACVHRIQMNMYSYDQFFPGETMNTSVAGSISGVVGSVIAGVVLNNAARVQLESDKTAIRIHFRPFRTALDNETMYCAYWDFDIDDGVGGAGGWRTDGCRLNTSMLNSMVAICECNHLTNFAIVLARNATASRVFTISVLTGLGISAVCILVAICLQVAALKVLDHGNQQYKQRRSRLTVLLILSVNLLLLYITQTASSYAQGGTLLCWIFLIPAHYFNLSVFLSIGLEGISLYYTVVNVFQKEVSNFRLKALLLVQGIPAVIVLLCASIARSSYYRPQENDSNCWINRENAVLYAGYMPVIVLVLIVNSIIAVRVACLLRKLQSQSKNSVSIHITLQRARASLVIFFVLGFGWLPVVIIVFLPTPSTALLWIATIFIILQGVAVLLFQIQSESMLIRKACRSISVSFGAAGRPKSVGGTSDGTDSGAQMPATEGNKLQNGSLSGSGDP